MWTEAVLVDQLAAAVAEAGTVVGTAVAAAAEAAHRWDSNLAGTGDTSP